jgi:signal transduction histidine kinase
VAEFSQCTGLEERMSLAKRRDSGEADMIRRLRLNAARLGSCPPVDYARPKPGWREAAILTVALWTFILVIYLPILIERHHGEGWRSVALDASTVYVSAVFGMGAFAIYRATLDWRIDRRAAALALTLIACALSQTIFDYLWTGWVAQHLNAAWRSLPRDLSRSYGAAFNYLCVFGVNMALFQLLFVRHREVTRERQLAEARWAAQQAQLTALRYQLNPHFLFNTLNAISSLIVTARNDDAEAMTNKLCSFLRASLSSDPTELVPLETELGLIEDYLEIETVRFGERLVVEMPCSSDAAAVEVPSFLLQPLLENAIKYGVGPSMQPVTVRVSARTEGDMLMLSVENDAAAIPAGKKLPGAGVGLVNVQRRLEAIYGGAASVIAGPVEKGFVAAITIPIRRQRSSGEPSLAREPALSA